MLQNTTSGILKGLNGSRKNFRKKVLMMRKRETNPVLYYERCVQQLMDLTFNQLTGKSASC